MKCILDLNQQLDEMYAFSLDELSFKCRECGKTSKKRQHIRNHVQIHLDLGHTCHQCGKSYKTTNSLESHISITHNPKYKCKM